MNRLFYVTVLLSIVCQFPLANASELPDYLKPYLVEYDGKYKIIIDSFKDSDLSLGEKLKEYEKSLGIIKSEVRNKLIAELSEGPFSVSGNHSCTKGYSGGSKTCGPHCVESPNDEALYVAGSGHVLWNRDPAQRKNWGKEVGDQKYCYTKKKSGKGKDKYSVHATFAIPEAITLKKADKGVTTLFNYIITKSAVSI